MHHKQAISALLLLLLTAVGIRVSAQKMDQRLTLTKSSKLEIINHFGRVMVSAIPSVAGKSVESIVSAASNSGVGPGDLKVDQNPGSTMIEVRSANPNKRVDLTITVPERISLRVNTTKGEVNVSGNFREINVKTDTGTFALDVPTDAAPAQAPAASPAATASPTPAAVPAGEDTPKWDVNAAPGPKSTANIDVTEGTWMTVDVSPDGKEIVFDLLGDIYSLPIAGGQAKNLTTGAMWDMQPRFSPDGKKIAFTSDRAGGDNIWVMDRDGSNPKQETKESFRLLNSPTWSPVSQ